MKDEEHKDERCRNHRNDGYKDHRCPGMREVDSVANAKTLGDKE